MPLDPALKDFKTKSVAPNRKDRWSFWTISPPIIAVILALCLAGSVIVINMFYKNGIGKIKHNPRIFQLEGSLEPK